MKKNLKEEFPWLSKIPQGSHGSKIVFKKLWKVISDYVRIRDFIAYKRCISCSKAISRWKEWQAGHYVAFSKKPLDKLDEYDACIRMENILKEISKLKYKPSYFTKIKSYF